MEIGGGVGSGGALEVVPRLLGRRLYRDDEFDVLEMTTSGRSMSTIFVTSTTTDRERGSGVCRFVGHKRH